MAAFCLSLLPAAGRAHPHIFIDTAFRFVFDEAGRLAAIRVDWSYDEFYSLMLIEENGLDADADGTPEPARVAGFAGKDVDWEAGFPGDFTLESDGDAVALDRPVDHAARFEDGRMIMSHTRRLGAPLAVEGREVVARSYDPTYLVAYDVPADPGVEGRDGCAVIREAADREKAQEEYGDQLAAVDAASDPFAAVELDDIGILFADRFVLSCAASS
ncbi:DUF1007 family protein [Limimaricola pyoseonensis]|uniref:ABC-type uncharacterized transport system, substrate-binding protein n=1 Tax=Limimaricola pyoseonensis TaxID=521013 RepID=A0A1G6ZZQ0_9RHOB|nr:DUF1007 family protein [Limimaricola pyoseonensis]SDE08144.1 ABC-type uncharacterized transport system, substrate-binding protein [Limimaricola pyoseonensis]